MKPLFYDFLFFFMTFLIGMVAMGAAMQYTTHTSQSISNSVVTPARPGLAPVAPSFSQCPEPEIKTEYVLTTEYVYVEPEFNYSTKNEPFAGYYYESSGIVEIYPNRLESFHDYMQIAAHEYGHYYFFKELTSADRNKICKEFRETEEFVREYASTNCEEYYAVTYWEAVA